MTKMQRIHKGLLDGGYLYVGDYEGPEGRKVVKYLKPFPARIVLVERFSADGRDEAVEIYEATPERSLVAHLERLTTDPEKEGP